MISILLLRQLRLDVKIQVSYCRNDWTANIKYQNKLSTVGRVKEIEWSLFESLGMELDVKIRNHQSAQGIQARVSEHVLK